MSRKDAWLCARVTRSMVPPQGVSGQVDKTRRSRGPSRAPRQRPRGPPPPTRRRACRRQEPRVPRSSPVLMSAGRSAFREAVQATMRVIPALGHPGDVPGRARGRQQGQQFPAARRRALGDDLHPAVLEVFRRANQAEFQRPRAHPPPEADALDAPGNPGGEPGGRTVGGIATGAGHLPADDLTAGRLTAGHLTTGYLTAGHLTTGNLTAGISPRGISPPASPPRHLPTGPAAAGAGTSGRCRTTGS